jgi:hypothetical protein
MEWPVILALVIGIPIVLFVPVLVWGAVVSGLYQVMRDAARRRATVARRRARLAEEPVVRR